MLRLADEINSCRAIQSITGTFSGKNLSGWEHKLCTATNIFNILILDLPWLVNSQKSHDSTHSHCDFVCKANGYGYCLNSGPYPNPNP